MAKSKTKTSDKRINPLSATIPTKYALLDLKNNAKLWYKIQAMVFDMHNLQKSPASWTRIDNTNDRLYIGAPYFTEEEAAIIKATLVHIEAPDEYEESVEQPTPVDSQEIPKYKTIEETIEETFQNFNQKREAAGDFRPCGPHDLAPVYLRIFDVKKEELSRERFSDRRLVESGIRS